MTISRRSLLTGGAAGLGVALLGCSPASPSTAPPTPTAPAAPTTAGARPIPAMSDVEARFGRQIGVHALDTGTGATVGHREGDRFLMLSVIKSVEAAHVLRRSVDDPGLLDRRLRWSRADLLDNSPVTTRNLATGMTVAELCDAAVTVSDNTSYIVLSRETGGPPALTAFLRGIGDQVSRADRLEPELNVRSGDLDTTTPATFTSTLRTLALGDALPAPQRAQLVGWLRATTTGTRKIRAGVPAGWQVGDKTGTGAAGESNDAAVLYPPQGAPVLLTVFTVPTDPEDTRSDEVVAETTRVALEALRGNR